MEPIGDTGIWLTQYPACIIHLEAIEKRFSGAKLLYA
jgi:hypothetical protein